eukprot:1636508-Lingulodinium_polyedra.AAC.1
MGQRDDRIVAVAGHGQNAPRLEILHPAPGHLGPTTTTMDVSQHVGRRRRASQKPRPPARAP